MSFNQRIISAWSNHWRSSATTHCLKQDQLQTYFKLPTCSRHILKLSLDSSLSRSVFNQSHCGHLFCLIPIRFSFAANSIHFFPPSYCAWLYLALSFPQPSLHGDNHHRLFFRLAPHSLASDHVLGALGQSSVLGALCPTRSCLYRLLCWWWRRWLGQDRRLCPTHHLPNLLAMLLQTHLGTRAA